MFFRNGTHYTVKVIKKDGKVAGADKVVIFNINGVFYNHTTDLLGIARLNINLIPGQYIITSTYENGAVTSNLVLSLPF